LSEAVGWVTKDSGESRSIAVDEDESVAVDLIVALPSNGETGIGFLEGQFLRIAIPRQACSEVIGGIEQQASPVSVENSTRGADSDKPAIAFGGATLNVVDFFGQAKVFARDCCFA
jgi:hypothetical protein